MVPVEPCVGVDVVAQSHPGGAAQLMLGEQAIPDSIGAAEDLPRQGVGAVRTWWHAQQPADHPSTADTPVDNLTRARRPTLWTTASPFADRGMARATD
ncbi:hypothetical protein [Micromonospora sp. LH3U1]|uniref:hypothetical protein n=1 Tax=Micromonospora sp. LH3U1 TaxID=3018339 RepID=UPI00234A95E9|nr:hypothetical protein [Micromonospora sp. LH3U1]WCN81182.1 hypothetical protein PCA76_30610 [Micromonospora sp. LH3U1]